MAKRRTKKPPKPKNASQLRDAIDSGRTGDKVPAEDPAAVPLGTDEEASGQPLGARHFEALKTQRTTASPQFRWRWRELVLATLLIAVVVAAVAAIFSL